MDVNRSVNGLNLFLRTKMRLSVVSPSALEPQRSLQTCRTDLTGSIHQTQELHLKLDAVKPAAVSDSLQSVWALIFTLFMTLFILTCSSLCFYYWIRPSHVTCHGPESVTQCFDFVLLYLLFSCSSVSRVFCLSCLCAPSSLCSVSSPCLCYTSCFTLTIPCPMSVCPVLLHPGLLCVIPSFPSVYFSPCFSLSVSSPLHAVFLLLCSPRSPFLVF